MTCGTCTKLRPIKQDSTNSCKKTKQKIEDVRVYCPTSVTELISQTVDTGCMTGYISNIINPDPVCNPSPIVCVDVLNPDDLDEINNYSFDRSEDIGTDTYSLSPLKLKIQDPEQQCTLDSWKGKDLAILYKIENKSGDFIWRRLLMKLTGVSGGLLAGYETTFDTSNPRQSEKPLFVNFGTAEMTENGIDAITDFDGSGECETVLYQRTFTITGSRIDITDYTLPMDGSKILVYRNGLLLTESHPSGYQISGNGLDLSINGNNTLFQIVVYA